MNDLVENQIDKFIQIKRQELLDKIQECGIDGGESTSDAIENLELFDEFIPRYKPLLMELVELLI